MTQVRAQPVTSSELNPLYLGNLSYKSRVSLRRRQKFASEDEKMRTSDESRWDWSRTKPSPIKVSIKTHRDLISALQAIADGEANHDDYHNVSGLVRDRLRTAQSLRDRGVEVDLRYLARADYSQLEELGCPSMRRTTNVLHLAPSAPKKKTSFLYGFRLADA